MRRSTRDPGSWPVALLGPVCLVGLVVCLVLIRTGQMPVLVVFAFLISGLTLLGFVKSQYLFLATVLFLPFEALNAPELPLNVQLVLFLTMIGLLVGFIRSPSLPRTPVDHLFLTYLGVLVISIVQTYVFSDLEPPQLLPTELGWRASPYRGWYHLVAIIMGMAIVYFTVRNVTSSARLKAAVLSLFSISLAVASFSLYEAVAKARGLPLISFSFRDSDYVSLSRYVIAGLAIPRVYGSASEPLSFGNFLLVPLSLSAAFLIVRKGLQRHRAIVYATLATAILALLLTFSTSAWFGALVSLCVLLALTRFRRVYRVVIPLLVVVMVILFFSPLSSQQMLQSISETEQNKIEASLGGNTRDFRYVGWQQSFSIIAKFPVLGVGLGNEPFWMDSQDLNIGSYNILLSHFVEAGALGCIVFSFIILRLVRLFWVAHQRAHDPEHAAISLGCAAALSGCLASHMAWGGRLASWEWFLIGLGLATQRVIQAERRAAQRSRARARGLSPRETSPWPRLRPRYTAGNISS